MAMKDKVVIDSTWDFVPSEHDLLKQQNVVDWKSNYKGEIHHLRDKIAKQNREILQLRSELYESNKLRNELNLLIYLFFGSKNE